MLTRQVLLSTFGLRGVLKMRSFILCIDGPAGSGKSTVSRMTAEKLGFVYLDTGAIYRSVALAADRHTVNWDDGEGLGALAGRISIEFRKADGRNTVLLDGEDVSEAIRSEHISTGSSRVARHPQVRAALLDLQRRIGAAGDCVAEGRDVGTVVFPEAQAKVYLNASVAERAARRYKQLMAKGENVELEAIEKDLVERDLLDSQREVAPLRQAEDAVELDTTGMSIEEVVDALVRLVEDRREA